MRGGSGEIGKEREGVKKREGGKEGEGGRGGWWGGGGENAILSSFLTEDARPSVRRQAHVWPSFVQHLTRCEGFSVAMPTCVADDVCVSSVP